MFNFLIRKIMRKIDFSRRILFSAAVALAGAALVGGCSDDKIVYGEASGKQISFRLQNDLPVTRATGTTTDNVNAFVVSAQVFDGEASPQILLGTDGTLFDAQTVARVEGLPNSFDYNPKRYYPDAAKTAYYSAYSPVTKNVYPGLKGNQDNSITYKVLPPDSIMGNTQQEDLLVAYKQVDGVVQLPAATPVKRNGFDEIVPLNFRHALSRVFVKAKNYNEEEVVIKKLSLNRLYDQGALDIDGKKWNDVDKVDIGEPYKAITSSSTTADYKVLWTFEGYTQNARYDYVLPQSGISVAAKTVQAAQFVVSKEQGMLILPQTTKNTGEVAAVDDGDFFVEVTYSISNIKNKTVRAAFSDLYGISGATGRTFEFGKQYALEVGFHSTAVTFEIDVEAWDLPMENPVANTTVIFADNKPVNATGTVTATDGITNNVCSKFIYNQSITATTGSDVLGKSIPAITGWKFLGYYDAPVGGKQYFKEGENSDAGKLVLATGISNWDKAGPAYTLYAQWKASTGTITVEANGGVAGSITTINWTYDSPLPDLDPAELPTKSGYTRTGLWSATSDGVKWYDADGVYIHGTVYNETNKPTDDKLYAQYEGKTITVTVDLQGGKYAGETSLQFTQQIGKTAYSLTESFTFTGKSFGGLYTEADGGGTKAYDKDSGWQTNYSTWADVNDGANIRLYVKWE